MRAGILAAIGLALLAGLLWFIAASQPAAKAPETNTAELAYRRGSFVLKLTDEPCPYEEIGAVLDSEAIPPAKAYRELLSDGRWALPGCWAKDISGDVMTMDTASDERKTLPKEWLNRAP